MEGITPFPLGKVAVLDLFTDREQQRKRLEANIRNHVSTVLVSPRRWGKSSLVRQVALDMKRDKKVRFCFIDLFKTRTEEEFYAHFAKQVVEAASTKMEDRLADIKQFLKQLVPFVQVGIDPNSEIKFTAQWKELERSRDDILDLPEQLSKAKGITLVVCLDEFQSIDRFSDPLSFQQRLRANWQHHQRAVYCLYGSRRHLMMEIFTGYDRPFYRFGDLMLLDKIEHHYWVSYIPERFIAGGKRISTALADDIATRMGNHPYGVQQLAYSTFLLSKKQCKAADIDQAMEHLLDHHAMLYQRIVEEFTLPQLGFLKAVLSGETKMSSKEVVDRYGLGTSGNVGRIRDAMRAKDILDFEGPETEWLDPLFRIWMQQRYWSPGELGEAPR